MIPISAILTSLRLKLLPQLFPSTSILHFQLDHILDAVAPIPRIRPDPMISDQRAQIYLPLPCCRIEQLLAALKYHVQQLEVTQHLMYKQCHDKP